MKDGKVLCFGCGRRVDGMTSSGHAFTCIFNGRKK